MLLVTEDDERHVVRLRADEVTAFASLLKPDSVLLFDPEAQTVVFANVLGEWLPGDFTAV